MRIAFVQKLINRLRNKDQKFFEFCVKIFTDKYLGAKKIKYMPATILVSGMP